MVTFPNSYEPQRGTLTVPASLFLMNQFYLKPGTTLKYTIACSHWAGWGTNPIDNEAYSGNLDFMFTGATLSLYK
jgi:hypothetical protein